MEQPIVLIIGIILFAGLVYFSLRLIRSDMKKQRARKLARAENELIEKEKAAIISAVTTIEMEVYDKYISSSEAYDKYLKQNFDEIFTEGSRERLKELNEKESSLKKLTEDLYELIDDQTDSEVKLMIEKYARSPFAHNLGSGPRERGETKKRNFEEYFKTIKSLIDYSRICETRHSSEKSKNDPDFRLHVRNIIDTSAEYVKASRECLERYGEIANKIFNKSPEKMSRLLVENIAIPELTEEYKTMFP